MNNPDTVIADEPTGNVDVDMTSEIMDLLMKINRLGKTVVVVTHDMNIVRSYKKRVITVDSGKVVSDRIGGTFDE